jgi:hypothetical protein
MNNYYFKDKLMEICEQAGEDFVNELADNDIMPVEVSVNIESSYSSYDTKVEAVITVRPVTQKLKDYCSDCAFDWFNYEEYIVIFFEAGF